MDLVHRLLLGVADGLGPGLTAHHRAAEGSSGHCRTGGRAGAEETTPAEAPGFRRAVDLVAHVEAPCWHTWLTLVRFLLLALPESAPHPALSCHVSCACSSGSAADTCSRCGRSSGNRGSNGTRCG